MEGYINIKKRISTFLTTKPTGRIIVSLLGILILLGGLGAGVILIKQQQLFNQKAADVCGWCMEDCLKYFDQAHCEGLCEPSCGGSNPTPTPGGGGGGGGQETCSDTAPTTPNCRGQNVGYRFCLPEALMYCFATERVSGNVYNCGQDGVLGGGGVDCSSGNNPTPTPGGGGGGSGTCDPPSVANCQGQSVGYEFCFLGWKMKCVDAGYGTCGQDYTSDPPTSCSTNPTPTPGGGGGGGGISGCRFDGGEGACRGNCPEGKYCGYGPQNPSCYCVDTDSGSTGESVTGTYSVTAYNTSWQSLDQTKLSALKAGDKIRFAVSGSSAAQIDKARFIINGTIAEVTQREPKMGEYYYEYTLPAGVADFTINAQLHSVNSGWF